MNVKKPPQQKSSLMLNQNLLIPQSQLDLPGQSKTSSDQKKKGFQKGVGAASTMMPVLGGSGLLDSGDEDEDKIQKKKKTNSESWSSSQDSDSDYSEGSATPAKKGKKGGKTNPWDDEENRTNQKDCDSCTGNDDDDNGEGSDEDQDESIDLKMTNIKSSGADKRKNFGKKSATMVLDQNNSEEDQPANNSFDEIQEESNESEDEKQDGSDDEDEDDSGENEDNGESDDEDEDDSEEGSLESSLNQDDSQYSVSNSDNDNDDDNDSQNIDGEGPEEEEEGELDEEPEEDEKEGASGVQASGKKSLQQGELPKPSSKKNQFKEAYKTGKKTFNNLEPFPNFRDMALFCPKGQSYQVIKCYKELRNSIKALALPNTKMKKSTILGELGKIGGKIYLTKSLIYGVQEVISFPDQEYTKALNLRKKLRLNYLLKNHVDNKPLFNKYLNPGEQNKFQKKFNAFLLFMFNNSQDELLMAYTDFCKQYFKAGLPSKDNGSMPQNYTHNDIRELEQFFKQLHDDIMPEKSFTQVVQKHLLDTAGKMWKLTQEKDNDGANIKIIKYKDALPFILLGFFCYITSEVDKRYSLIAHTEPAASQENVDNPDEQGEKSKTSLDACFEKAGLKLNKWNKRVVDYSMTENALLFYQQKHTLNIDQVELILRMVRERMDVNQMYRCESKKEYFDHALPRKSFGRWLMAELALQKKMKDLATIQHANMTMNRDKFRRALIQEEKLVQIAINMEKLDHESFIKLVTKNLMIILHARKSYGIILELDKYKSVKEALMAQLKQEEYKAKDIIMKEYIKKALKRHEAADKLAKEQQSPDKLKKIKKWNKINKMIIQKKEQLEERVSATKNYELFKNTMWQKYWHTFFEKKIPKRNRPLGKDIVNQEGYEGPTNLTHYTVHEFNEALYFALREYSSYVNFSQVENATYTFFMDAIINEEYELQKQAHSQLVNQAAQNQESFDKQYKEENGAPDSENKIYPVHMNQQQKFYSRIFVDEYPSRDRFNEASHQVHDYDEDKNIIKRGAINKYQDTLPYTKISDHIRNRDKTKVTSIQHMKNPLQTEVEAFRSMKLCDLEFTRYAYQIIMDEAHRQAMQTMTLMYLSSPRCKVSHHPEELVAGEKGEEQQNSRFMEISEKLKRNNFLKKKEIAQVRNTFKEERFKKIKITKAKQRADFDTANKVVPDKIEDMELSDIFPPLNHFGNERFDEWTEQEKMKLKKVTKEEKFADKKIARDSMARFFKQPEEHEQVKPVGKGQEDMVNILLTMNYLSGFAKYVADSSKKTKEEPAIQDQNNSTNSDTEDEEQSKYENKAFEYSENRSVRSHGKNAGRITLSVGLFGSKPTPHNLNNKLIDSEPNSEDETVTKQMQRPKFNFNTKIKSQLFNESDKSDESNHSRKGKKEGAMKNKKKDDRRAREGDARSGSRNRKNQGHRNRNDDQNSSEQSQHILLKPDGNSSHHQNDLFSSKHSMQSGLKDKSTRRFGAHKSQKSQNDSEIVDPDDIEMQTRGKGIKNKDAPTETGGEEKKAGCSIF